MQEKKKDRDLIFWASIFFDVILIFLLAFALFTHYLKIFNLGQGIFIILAFVGVIPVFISAVRALIRRRLTIDLLASIALIFAFLSGEWNSVAFINLMLAFARIFDHWTAMRTKHTIEHLLKYRPEKVKIQKGSQIVEIKLEKLKIGDEVVIEAGDRVPVDGTVISGTASINESILTGESEPVSKVVGSAVYTSTLNEAGSLLVRVEKIGEDTTLAKIISLVEEASRKKAGIERVAERFTQWYIFLTIAGSIVLFFILKDTNMVLAVLLVVCADDIAVAVPLSYTAAIARAAERGIVIKGSEVIEKLPKIKYFMTDKTGTLTQGKPRITGVKTFKNLPHEKFLALIGTAEINSHHPVGIAIVDYAKNSGVKILAPEDCNEVPGEGVSCITAGKKMFSGKISFLERNKIKILPAQKTMMEEEKAKGYGLVALGRGAELLGYMVMEDALRPFAHLVIKSTKKLGAEQWIMLTGDNEKVASRVAGELGIDKFEANLKPEQKLKYIENFKKTNPGILAMMGDGVNDAAALALADVSFAMGAIGSDAAIEAADVALMHDNLERVPESMTLAKKTMGIIKQNFILWGATNVVGLVLVFTGVIGPVGAATYNFVTDFFPIMNALRISFDYKKLKFLRPRNK
ncbi:MAG: cation-translocating P-type ATPase [bacterium]